MINDYLEKVLEKYKNEKTIYEPLVIYFEKNLAARKYGEVCQEQNWDYVIDHLTVRTYSVEKSAQDYIKIGYKFSEKVDYKNEGWWANVYRHLKYPAVFVDQTYDGVPESQEIIKKWVDKFGDKEYHHIAVLLPQGVEIEKAIEHLKKKGINFPGKVTGPKETQLRQIFTQAEIVNDFPYSVLELTQRNKDPKTQKTYEGFITMQADSLMKDSVL